MSIRPRFLNLAALAVAAVLAGCATPQHSNIDYSALRAARPATLLVLPPLNDSPDVKASATVWAHATRPLAEAGYYVLPVTLVNETFRQNGVTTAHDAHHIPYAKLREYFGADAGVYITVQRYGTSYAVISSQTRVDVKAEVVDLRTGQSLWKGSAFSTSGDQSSGGSVAAILVSALVNQVVNTATDAAARHAVIANAQLFSPARRDGLLPGPRSPLYGQDLQPKR